MSLKEIQSKLLLWEASENALAPLTSDQREAILDLESLILGGSTDIDNVCSIRLISYILELIIIKNWYKHTYELNLLLDFVCDVLTIVLYV